MLAKYSALSFLLAGTMVSAANEVGTDLFACYKNLNWKEVDRSTFQTAGRCLRNCTDIQMPLAGITRGYECYCGDIKEEDVGAKSCNLNCESWKWETCGNDDGTFFSVYRTTVGRLRTKEQLASESSTKSTQPTQTPPPVQTVVAPPSATPTKAASVSKAGAAAGAVVGVLVAAAIGVGIFFFIRKRRQQKVEDDYRKTVQAHSFASSKPESDSRLDPVMLQHRRVSTGSIADNEDYSRRILKVTNPDG